MSIPQQAVEDHQGSHDAEPDMWEVERQEQPKASSFERVPPQDIDAEQSVLGGMMLSKDAIADVIEELEGPADFYRPAHETIYRAILDMYAKGDPADPITVAAELEKRGELARIGYSPYLHTLVNTVPTAANAQYYAAIVREKAIRRRLVEAGTKIVHDGYQGDGEPEELVDRAQSDLYKVMGDRTQKDALPLSATAQAMIDRIQRRKTEGKGLRGIATGFTDFDQLTRGLLGGQFIVIAARPAIGKSTLAVDWVRECSVINKIPSAFFSLEMGRHEVEERILSAQAKVPHHHIQSGDVSDDDWLRIARHMDDIGASPMYIDDSENVTFMELAAKARRLKQKHDIRLIVVDYLQLMKSGSRAESRQQEVADISRNFKLLAKALNVPIVALSQLNRGPEQRTDKKPLISDLRESGAIEQDADMVVLLHREDAYDKESPRAGEADLIVAKHRNGATCTITVAFQGHYCRFTDMAKS
jgi:replicative DNA helicase